MKKIIAVAVASLPSMAFAHPGHTESFLTAFAHPFTGIDHLLMILGVGIYAGRIGGSARWQLPLAFLIAMTIGWLSATMGFTVPGIESGIAAGLIVLGVMLMLRNAMPFVLQLCVVAMFAALHGAAHGAELSNTTPIATGMGMLLATAALHGIGVVIAALVPSDRQSLYRGLGTLFSLVGGSFLLGIS